MAITLNPTQRREIGRRISTLRIMLGMKQSTLATQCGVSQPAVSQWEAGRTLPAAALQPIVADALRTTRARLFRELAEAEWQAAGEAS